MNLRYKSFVKRVFGFKIIVNDWLEYFNYEKGTDLADVYISEKNCFSHGKKETEIQYANTEKIVHRLEQHSPEIRLLIEPLIWLMILEIK